MHATKEEIEAARSHCPEPRSTWSGQTFTVPVWRKGPELASDWVGTPHDFNTIMVQFRCALVVQDGRETWQWGYVSDKADGLLG